MKTETKPNDTKGKSKAPPKPTPEKPKEPAKAPGVDTDAYYKYSHDMALKAVKLREIADNDAAVAKQSKKAADEAAASLVIYAAGAKMPLFDGKPKPTAKPESNWRTLGIVMLGLKPGVTKALMEKNNIKSVGDLVAFQSTKTDFWVKDLKGIGRAAGTEIEDALMKFWKDHPEACSKEQVELQAIVSGKSDVALKAIVACTDVAILDKAFKAGLKGAWRRSAVAKRKKQLEAKKK